MSGERRRTSGAALTGAPFNAPPVPAPDGSRPRHSRCPATHSTPVTPRTIVLSSSLADVTVSDWRDEKEPEHGFTDPGRAILLVVLELARLLRPGRSGLNHGAKGQEYGTSFVLALSVRAVDVTRCESLFVSAILKSPFRSVEIRAPASRRDPRPAERYIEPMTTTSQSRRAEACGRRTRRGRRTCRCTRTSAGSPRALGRVIRRLEGDEAFETVEELRRASRARRHGDPGAPSLDELLARVEALPLELCAIDGARLHALLPAHQHRRAGAPRAAARAYRGGDDDARRSRRRRGGRCVSSSATGTRRRRGGARRSRGSTCDPCSPRTPPSPRAALCSASRRASPTCCSARERARPPSGARSRTRSTAKSSCSGSPPKCATTGRRCSTR